MTASLRERERSNDDEIGVRSKAPSKQRWSDLVTVVVVSGWASTMVRSVCLWVVRSVRGWVMVEQW